MLPEQTAGDERYRSILEFLRRYSLARGEHALSTALPTLATKCWHGMGAVHALPEPLALEERARWQRRIARPLPPAAGLGIERVGECLVVYSGTSNQERAMRPVIQALGREVEAVTAPANESRGLELAAHGFEVAEALLAEVHASKMELPFDAAAVHRLFRAASWHLARIEAAIRSVRPRAILLPSTTGHWCRATCYAARRSSIATVLIPHAPASGTAALADLPVDYVGLRGRGEADWYASQGVEAGLVDVVGAPSIPLESDAAQISDPRLKDLPVFAPSPLSPERLTSIFRLLDDPVVGSLAISPHPGSDILQLERLCPRSWTFWRGRTLDLLSRETPFLIQQSSGVALEAFAMGVPVIELRFPGEDPRYPMIREPVVHVASGSESLHLAVAEARRLHGDPGHARLLREWAQQWCSPRGPEAAREAGRLVEEAMVRGPRDRPIWDAWTKYPVHAPAEVR